MGPAAATERWLERDAGALSAVLSRYHPVMADRGEGSWLVDVDGRRYLDLTAGIAVTCVGHCHPRVTAAIQEQAARLAHTSVVVHHQRAVELAERLGSLCPWFDEPRTFFCNSGAEAVDGAVKLARRATGRPAIVAFAGAFHGRTLAATTLTATRSHYRHGYEPLLPSVHHAPYGDPRRGSAADHLAALDDLFAARVEPSTVAAVVVEPVLGEGGYVVPAPGWLEGLRERCSRHGILLVFDEVQTGIGRTGRPFAAETFGVHPDVLLTAKALAGGLPLGAIVAERSLHDLWPPGAHGSTFGGNPVACAAALAVLDVLEAENLCERAAALGARCLERLRRLGGGRGGVVDVRGAGLMVGVELDSGERATRARERCRELGVLVLSCGPRGEVLRLVPPLTITDGELSHGLDVVAAALSGEPGGRAPVER